MEAKLKALLELGHLQSQVGSLFARAETIKLTGAYDAAHTAFDRYIAGGRAYLKAICDFNARFPESPFTLPEVVQPLINALMVDADIVHSLGKRAAAEALRQEALDLSRAYLGRRGTAESERSRAASLTLEGRFNEAITALMTARDVILEADDKVELARIALDLADVFQWLGDLRRAKEEIDHAASIIEPVVGERGMTQRDVLAGVLTSISSIMAGRGDPGDATRNAQLYRGFTEITYYRGLIAKALGRWEEAERHFVRVLPEYRALGTGEAIEYQLAQVTLGRGEAAEALTLARRIASVFDRGAFRPKRAVLQKLMAECLHALGDSDAALQLVGESIQDLERRHFDPDALWRSQHLQARIWSDRGDRASALKAFRDAVGTIGELRRAPLGYRLDSTYLADKKELFSRAIAEAALAGQAGDCCRFMESIKSRTLTAVLSIPRSGAETSADLGGQFDALTRQLDALEYQAYRCGWTAERRSAHHALLGTRTALLERIRIGDPRWRSLSQSPPLDLDRVLKVLAERSQAALTLYYDPPDLTGVLLADRDIIGARLKLQGDLPAKLADYAKNLQKPQPDLFKHDLSVEFSIRAEDLIPPPLLARAVTARSLVVVPHGLLHLVPWAALVHEGRRLFQRLPVGILPNVASVAADASFSTPRSVALLGVAEYPGLEALKDLPSARGEMEDIAGLYRDAGVAVRGPSLDADATERAFRTLAESVSGPGNLLHLSCHGTIVPNEPMSSGLLLFDAKLDAAELARDPLPFDEAVLSACSTGWRPMQVDDIVLTADEILGIPAGFLEAGVRAVLVSIPKAEGKAARALTTHYHRRRAAGDSPLFALQAAQRSLLESGTAPGAWVGFALYGCA